jgi:hypothetical protein
MGADHRLDPPPSNRELEAEKMAEEEMEATSVVLRSPPAKMLKPLYQSQRPLQLHLRISPKMRALEMPP